MNNPVEWLLLAVGLGLALQFRPWQMLRRQELQHPWLAALALLPWLWAAQGWVPGGLAVHLSGACLMVLMFGWPLAVLSLVPIGLAGAWLATQSWLPYLAHSPLATDALAGNTPPESDWLSALDLAVVQIVWYGLAPATLALGMNALVRRYLPHHLFVYILARGFIATALSTTLAGLGALLWRGAPVSTDFTDMLLAYWLLGWGEAFATGMFTAIFVAFKPAWLATYSDQRYLPPKV